MTPPQFQEFVLRRIRETTHLRRARGVKNLNFSFISSGTTPEDSVSGLQGTFDVLQEILPVLDLFWMLQLGGERMDAETLLGLLCYSEPIPMFWPPNPMLRLDEVTEDEEEDMLVV